MSKFKTGDRVQIVKSTAEDLNGMFGVIRKKGDGWDWWVTLEGGAESLGFDNYELAPAPQEPAPVSAAGLPAPTLDDVLRAGVAASDKVFELERKLAAATELAETNASLLANAQSELDTVRRDVTRLEGEYDRGWDGATQSMLSILERTLDNAPANHQLAAIETQIDAFRQTYPKAANALADGAGEAG